MRDRVTMVDVEMLYPAVYAGLVALLDLSMVLPNLDINRLSEYLVRKWEQDGGGDRAKFCCDIGMVRDILTGIRGMAADPLFSNSNKEKKNG